MVIFFKNDTTIARTTVKRRPRRHGSVSVTSAKRNRTSDRSSAITAALETNHAPSATRGRRKWTGLDFSKHSNKR